MKIAILIIIGSLSLVTCRAQSNSVVLNNEQIINELIRTFKILPETAKPTSITEAELNSVEEIAKECIEKHNTKIEEEFKERGEKRKSAELYKILNLENYKIQYIPYLNEKGEKEILINGFCSDLNGDWKKEIVYVFDGGNCYFKIRINLSTGECLEIGTNGYA